MADIKDVAIDGVNYNFKDAKARDDVSDLKEDIEKILVRKQYFKDYDIVNGGIYPLDEKTSYSAEATTISGSAALKLNESSNFNTYCFTSDSQITIACPPTGYSYYAICILTNPSSTSWISGTGYIYKSGATCVRYRLSDGNLPTVNNPVTIPAGAIVSVTVKSTDDAPKVLIYTDELLELIKDKPLGDNGKSFEVEMHSTYFYYYKPTRSGNYLRFKFNHYTSVADNAEGWVQREVDLVDRTKSTVLMKVVVSGEWEMAIRIADSPDFIGCQNHGSEVTTLINFYFDGINRTVTDGQTFYCKEIKINEKSTMYDPRDETTIVGYHYKIYTITIDKIKIEQKIEWVHDETLDKSYVLMMPAVRGNDSTSAAQITDRVYDEKTFTEYDCSTTTINPYMTGLNNKGNILNLYGTTSGISISTICEIKNRLAEAFSYLSNSVYYNKIYFGYNGDNYSVSNGDVWEWTSIYIFDHVN